MASDARVTRADRRTADGLVAFYRGLRKGSVPDPAETGELATAIAAALAEERAKAHQAGWEEGYRDGMAEGSGDT